jgi:hypothetical protein
LVAQDSTKRTTIGGYGEVHYINPSGTNTPAEVNVARFIIYLGHSFSDRITLRSELELEDTKVEGGEPGGEVALEQAYLDYRFSSAFTLRAGLLLVPVGILNELHEPPTFNGVARPLYDRVIIPTTWRDIGVGVAGVIPGAQGLSYRAYLLNGLVANSFGAETGIRGGRQEGREASFANAAVVARVEYARPGLKLGLSGYRGGSANEEAALGTGLFSAPVTIVAADARYNVGPLGFRAEAANIGVSRAGEINQAFGTDVGSRIRGWYLEGAYDVLHHLKSDTPKALAIFARYEHLDTQAAVPVGTIRVDENARRITTLGLTFKPVSEVAVKADYQLRRNRAGLGEDQVLSLGIGYQF